MQLSLKQFDILVLYKQCQRTLTYAISLIFDPIPSYGFHIWDSNLRLVSTLIKSRDLYHSMDLNISFCLTTTILMIVPLIIAAGLNVAFAQEPKKENGMMNNMSIDSSGNSQIITSFTEWIGIGALTILTGVLLLFGNNIMPTKNANTRNTHRIMEKNYLSLL